MTGLAPFKGPTRGLSSYSGLCPRQIYSRAKRWRFHPRPAQAGNADRNGHTVRSRQRRYEEGPMHATLATEYAPGGGFDDQLAARL